MTAPPTSTRRQAEHGTRSKYNTGCRCDDCRDANRVYMETRRIEPRASTRSWRHGTYATYNYRGCRCGPCCSARNAYERARRAIRRKAS